MKDQELIDHLRMRLSLSEGRCIALEKENERLRREIDRLVEKLDAFDDFLSTYSNID